MEGNQSAPYHQYYGAPNPSPSQISPTQHQHPAYSPHTILPSFHPLALPSPHLVSPIQQPPIPVVIGPGYAFYPPSVATPQYSAPQYHHTTCSGHIQPPILNQPTKKLSRKSNRRAANTTSKQSATTTPQGATDTTPPDGVSASASDSLPQKPKKHKTPARLAREMARKLKHRERRRIGRRERRNAVKKGDGESEEALAMEEGSISEADGIEDEQGSESAEHDDISVKADDADTMDFPATTSSFGVDGGNDNHRQTSSLVKGTSKQGDNSMETSLDGRDEAASQASGSQSLSMSDDEDSGLASPVRPTGQGTNGQNTSGPLSDRSSKAPGSRPRTPVFETDTRGFQRTPPSGPRFQAPTGPRSQEVFRFGERGGRREEGTRFDFETDNRGLHFPETEPGYRDRYRDRDRRPGDRREFHTDSKRRFGDRDGPRMPIPAHDRPILHVRRSATPEQFPEMVAAKRQRLEDDNSEADMEIDSNASDNEAAAKEAVFNVGAYTEVSASKTTQAQATGLNGEPMKTEDPSATVKKVDVISMIRKAKQEVLGNRKDISAASGDFISLSGFDDESAKLPALPLSVPTGTAFSHRDFLHGQDLANRTQPLERAPAPGTNIIARSLSPPPGLGEGAGKKRTHSEMAPEVAFQVPWVKTDETDHSKSLYPSAWLHKEIIDFYDYIKPKPYEHVVRHDIVRRLRNIVQDLWRDADVRCFGSFASEIYLPTSDMDVVVVSEDFMRGSQPRYNTRGQLLKLSGILRRSDIVQQNSLVPIVSAKVPIIKYKDSLTGISVDISFENTSGITAIRTFKQWKEIYPEMPKLALLLKHFLMTRQLNEPFNGGLGSFSLICMIVSMMQLMPEASSGNWHGEQNLSLGRLLMEFLELYGTKFNATNVGICVREPGYFKKSRRPELHQANKPHMFTIEDPNDRGNNIAKATFQFAQIQKTFAEVYEDLNSLMGELHQLPFEDRKGQSLLGPIIGGFSYNVIDNQRRLMQRTFLGRNLGEIGDLITLGGSDPDAPVVKAAPVARQVMSAGADIMKRPKRSIPPAGAPTGPKSKPSRKEMKAGAGKATREAKKRRREAKVKKRGDQTADKTGQASSSSGNPKSKPPADGPKRFKKPRHKKGKGKQQQQAE